VGSSLVPDLRYSGIVRTRKAFNMVMLDGVMEQLGMVSFAPIFSDQDVKDIRQYLIRESQTARKYGETHRIGR
jgi:quinohemoprotein ethanol dehydrogenase